MNEDVADLNDDWMPTISAVSKIGQLANSVRRAQLMQVASSDAVVASAMTQQIQQNTRDLLALYPQREALISDNEEGAIWDRARTAWTQYQDIAKRADDLLRADHRSDAQKLLFGEAAQAFDRALAAFDDNMNYGLRGGAAAGVRAHQAYGSGLWIVSGLLAIVVVLGALAAWIIGRTITRPVQQSMKVLQAVAAGDYSQRMDVAGRDEMGGSPWR